jgi:hypothetical protein
VVFTNKIQIMKNMQQCKSTQNCHELGKIISDTAKGTDALSAVMNKFNCKGMFNAFDSIKRNGVVVSQILTILVILPFYHIASIRALFKSGIGANLEGGKDVFYDLKNNEKVNWRTLLLLMALRFEFLIKQRDELKGNGVTALIFDDTTIEKTSKKTEKVSYVHDHTESRFILGYKLLVCGYWDGGSFIPLDFSIHREKGKALEKAIKTLKKKEANLARAQQSYQESEKKYTIAVQKHKEQRKISKDKNDKTSQQLVERAKKACSRRKEELKKAKQELFMCEQQVSIQKQLVKETEKSRPTYGLSRKEKKEQYKKKRTKGSPGYERSKEADNDKIENSISMLRRVVKKGFIPQYVLTDSWFFCYALLDTVSKIANGQMKLISMAKMGKNLFTLPTTKEEHNAYELISMYKRKATYCKKLKAYYLKVPCMYKGIRVNLFFIRMGKREDWKLIITNDINLNFIKLMEIYHIRWSIEVFFKESKQHLNLGRSLSQDFDAQIADATMTMIQYIMLSYYKRINYQQSFGSLFKEISSQMIEKCLAQRLWEAFLELINLMGDFAGIDVMEFFSTLHETPQVMEIVTRIFSPQLNVKEIA